MVFDCVRFGGFLSRLWRMERAARRGVCDSAWNWFGFGLVGVCLWWVKRDVGWICGVKRTPALALALNEKV